MTNANASKARSNNGNKSGKNEKYVPSENLKRVAQVLDAKDVKYINKGRALKALRAVIHEGETELEMSYIAAQLAVAIDDELKAARKRHAREGFIRFLEAGKTVCIKAVYRHDPSISKTVKKIPGFMAFATMFKPEKVYNAEFQAEMRDALYSN